MAESLQSLDIQVTQISSDVSRVRLLYLGKKLIIEPPHIIREFKRCGIRIKTTPGQVVAGLLGAFVECPDSPIIVGESTNFDMTFDPMGFVYSFRALKHSQADIGWKCVMGAAIISPYLRQQFLHDYAMPMDFLLRRRNQTVNIEYEATLLKYGLEFEKRRAYRWRRLLGR